MFYEKHLFFCENQRDNGKQCCADGGSKQLREYAKKRLKELSLHGSHKIRVSGSGCLGRCECGPCLVIYPEGTWYQVKSFADVDRIIDEHLLQGDPVPDLQIPEDLD